MNRCWSDNDDVPRARESRSYLRIYKVEVRCCNLRTQVDVQLENSKNVATVCVLETRATIRSKLRFVKRTNETVFVGVCKLEI